MASSNASVSVLSENPVGENIAPLESVVTELLSESHLRTAAAPESPSHLTPPASAHGLNSPPSSEQEDSSDAALESQRSVLQKLKAWHQWDTDRYKSLGNFLLSKVGYPKRPICPTNTELLSLATFFFPHRHWLKAVVCDFDINGVKKEEVDLADVRQYWENKPSYGLVRWIHIPVGSCSFASSLEREFSNSYRGAVFHPTMSHGFEILNFRGRQYLQDQSDVLNILRNSPHLSAELGRLSKMKDAEIPTWIARMEMEDGLTKKYGFRKDVQSDLPWQLDEGIRSDFPKLDLKNGALEAKINQQFLSRYPAYSNAVLVRDSFRCSLRDDGFLLTTSPAAGLSYLDTDFKRLIMVPPNSNRVHQGFDVFEALTEQWILSLESGQRDLPVYIFSKPDVSSKLVRWLMVLLIIELMITPNNDRAKDVPDIQHAYLPIVRDLKRRRAFRFKRFESVNLVREYVSCMDELSQIHDLSIEKVEFLQRFMDAFLKQSDNSLDNEISERMFGKINAAMRKIKKDNENLPRLILDLKSSLDVLFQLRTMEQNELAIIAESNNKAILVFTVVTIVFLPLSFFTSYFGMNIQGIANSDKTQGYFWAVCGSITLFVVSFTVVFGFKERLYSWIWANRDYSRPQHLSR